MTLIHLMHASMQYSDTKDQQLHDASAVFEYAKANKVWWVTGTEANAASDRANFAKGASDHGFRFFHDGGDVWVGVNSAITKPEVQVNAKFYLVIHGKAGSYPNRGPLRVSFPSAYGRINVLACHYNLSGPKHPRAPGAKQNPQLAREIGRLTRLFGRGTGLVFYGGDQNLHDEKPGVDTFYGQPLTSAWDELKHYEHTHPGRETIDVIASYNNDTRVSAKYVHALDDTKLALHTDHYPVVAGYDIKSLKK